MGMGHGAWGLEEGRGEKGKGTHGKSPMPDAHCPLPHSPIQYVSFVISVKPSVWSIRFTDSKWRFFRADASSKK